MSYDIVKSISIKKDKVFLTSADSSLRPLYFHQWECEPLSKMLREEGQKAVLCRLGEDIWGGSLRVYKGSKLCNLFLQARNELPRYMNWSNFDSKAAGEFLGNAVMKLSENPKADLSEDVTALLALRNDKDYILEAAFRTGRSYLDFAEESVQKDREFALKVILAAGGSPSFNFPQYFKGDKALAMAAIESNGCIYRQLDESLRGDREVVFAAFAEVEGKRFHEHLPDLIPPMTFFDFSKDPLKPLLDKDFALELIRICPSLHIERTKWLLQDKDIALEWCKVGKYITHNVAHMPQEYLIRKDFQDVLMSRCQDEKQRQILEKKLNEAGVLLRGSLEEKISAAKTAGVEAPSVSHPVKESTLER